MRRPRLLRQVYRLSEAELGAMKGKFSLVCGDIGAQRAARAGPDHPGGGVDIGPVRTGRGDADARDIRARKPVIGGGPGESGLTR